MAWNDSIKRLSNYKIQNNEGRQLIGFWLDGIIIATQHPQPHPPLFTPLPGLLSIEITSRVCLKCQAKWKKNEKCNSRTCWKVSFLYLYVYLLIGCEYKIGRAWNETTEVSWHDSVVMLTRLLHMDNRETTLSQIFISVVWSPYLTCGAWVNTQGQRKWVHYMKEPSSFHFYRTNIYSQNKRASRPLFWKYSMNVRSYFMKHWKIHHKAFMWGLMNVLHTHPSSKVSQKDILRTSIRHILQSKPWKKGVCVNVCVLGWGCVLKKKMVRQMPCFVHRTRTISTQSTTQLPLRCVYCQKFHPHKKSYIIQSWPFAELFEIPLQGAICVPCPGVMRRYSVGFIPRLQCIFWATPLVLR